MYAIAIDLGTTTLAASLIERTTGRRLAMVGSMNPQRSFGADVVSRLDAALRDSSAASAMTVMIREELARLADILLADAGLKPEQLELVAVAGNPAMQHILLGWPLESLARPPFRPCRTEGVTLPAADLGWPFGCSAYLLPQPGGFVGGDIVAFIHAAWQDNRAPALYLDMGTNGEMVLDDGATLWATSAAAGPAFEAGNISCGMAALPGAISRVDCVEGRLKLELIGAGPARGLCGSALLDTVAMLRSLEMIDSAGRLLQADEVGHPLATRIVEQDGENSFVLYRDAATMVCLTQTDIRQLQLAKGALRAGMEVLLERARIRCEALQAVVLTGSFGAVLVPAALKTVGIFSEEMVKKSSFIREGALVGVELALTGESGIAALEQLACRFKVVPLSGTPLFESKFMEQINFPS